MTGVTTRRESIKIQGDLVVFSSRSLTARPDAFFTGLWPIVGAAILADLRADRQNRKNRKNRNRKKRRGTVPDVWYVLATAAMFAVLLVIVRGAEKL